MAKFNVACIGIIRREEKILLVKEGKASGDWAFPGGGLEKGETLEECVEREIKEETSLEVSDTKLIGTYVMQVDDDSNQMFVHAFNCRSVRNSVNTRDEDSVLDAKFVDKEDLDTMDLRFDEMREILEDSIENENSVKVEYL